MIRVPSKLSCAGGTDRLSENDTKEVEEEDENEETRNEEFGRSQERHDAEIIGRRTSGKTCKKSSRLIEEK